MRPRTLKIAVHLSGMDMPVATVKIQKFADVLTAETELLCPKCKQKPTWKGGYTCSCCPICGQPMEQGPDGNYTCTEHGQQKPSYYNHFSKLLRVVKATSEEITKTKFTKPKEPVTADAYIMDLADFSEIADATLTEYGVTTSDEASAKNLRNLLIATQNLRKVVLIRFHDTFEERIAILTTSISKRIILKEIIPTNLANIKETMRVNLSGVTEKEIAEAEQFVKMLPPAKPELLTVSDYRTIGIQAQPTTPKVLELEAIISQAST